VELESERGRGIWKIGAVVAGIVTILVGLLALLSEILR
jgi:hypothetical protein